MSRIPHGSSPVEIRKFAQRVSAKVTGGEDPGHSHTGASLSGIDISDDTNLAVTAPVVLTDDTLSLNVGAVDHNALLNTHNLTTDIDHASITNTHNLTTDIDHASITNTHNLTTDINHGAIGGLEDVADHPGYSLIDGTRAFTGAVSGIGPTLAAHLTTKEYVDSAISFHYRYFFNDDNSDIGGYYKAEHDATGDISSNFVTGPLGAGAAQALTDWASEPGEPGVRLLKAGIYSVHIHTSVSGTKPTRVFFRLYKRTHPAGAETLLATSEYSGYITDGVGFDIHAILAADVVILATDRLVWKLLANVEATGSNVTVTLYAEGASSTHADVPTSTEVLSTIFLRQDGTETLTGDLAVDPGITIDGRDIRLDGMDLDTLVTLIGKMKVDTSATADYLGAAFNDGVLRTSTGISYADGGNFVTLTTNDGEIDHDSLLNFVATKHFDTTSLTTGSVIISNGTTFVEDNVGLLFDIGNNRLGIGSALPQKNLHIESITPTIRLCDTNAATDRGVSTLIEFYRGNDTNRVGYLAVDSNANDILTLATEYADGEIRLRTGNAVDRLIIDKDGNVSILGNAVFSGTGHDSFTDFVANKHVDHTGVSIATAATSGISGGGTIAATRNLALNINGLTGESAIVVADTLAFYDDTAGANRKITLTELSTALGAADEKVKVDVAATAGYLGVAAGDGVLRTDSTITWADGGNFVTLSAPVAGFTTRYRGHMSADQDIVTNTYTKAVLDVEDYDTGGDGVNGTFTAPATGYYAVSVGSKLFETIDAGKFFFVFIYLDGIFHTAQAVNNIGAGANVFDIKFSDILYATSGQTIEMYVWHNHGSNREIQLGEYTFMAIHRLS